MEFQGNAAASQAVVTGPGDAPPAGQSPLRAAVEDACMLFHTTIRQLVEDYKR